MARTVSCSSLSVGGLSPGADSSARLQLKVNEKAKQLPPSQPNLLVIFAHDRFLHVGSPVKLLPLGAAVISRHDRIALLVLTSEDFGRGVPHAMEVDGNIVTMSDRDSLIITTSLSTIQAVPRFFPSRRETRFVWPFPADCWLHPAKTPYEIVSPLSRRDIPQSASRSSSSLRASSIAWLKTGTYSGTAGKQRPNSMRKGSPWLKTILIQCARV